VITEIVMPQMGLEVTEGTVVELLAAVGEEVGEGQPVIVISTDKADADVMAPRDGVVREILVELEQTVEVGVAMMLIADSADEPLGDGEVRGEASGTMPAETVDAPDGSAGGNEPEAPAAAQPVGGNGSAPRLRAAPIARRAAAKLGVDLAAVQGTGPSSRITLKDVEAAAAAPAAQAAPAAASAPGPGFEAFSPLRRAIAQRMTTSQAIPQYQLTREIDMRNALAAKARIARAQPDAAIGVNDFLIKALGMTVERHPLLAARFVEQEGVAGLEHTGLVNVGLAVAGEAGLLVPVIKGVDDQDLAAIAATRRALTAKARKAELRLDELSDGVVTLSNLGGFGIDSFTAMVNPGQSSIAAVGRTVDRMVPVLGGIEAVPTMSLSWTFDHRVLDGAVGAAALSTLADLLEEETEWN
jgi:pyruvate dehydrogenase E2 component (dihydrolipoamide acetyltransferase)